MKRSILFAYLLMTAMLGTAVAQGDNTVSITGVRGPYFYSSEGLYLMIKNLDGKLVSEHKIQMDKDGRYEVSGIPKGQYILTFLWNDFTTFSDTLITLDKDCDLDTLRYEYNSYSGCHYIWRTQCLINTPSYSTPFREIYINYRKAIDNLNLVFDVDNESYCYITDNVEDVNDLLSNLEGVRLKEGMLLDVSYFGGWGGGGVYYYCRKAGEPKPDEIIYDSVDNILNSMIVDFTPEGIWSAYQLEVSYRYLPKYWHAYYLESWQVFSVEDELLNNISQTLYIDSNEELYKELKELPPISNSVEIIDSNNATVTSYYWNEWDGLVEEKVHVERVGETVRFIFYNKDNPDSRTSKRVLVFYWCGVDF